MRALCTILLFCTLLFSCSEKETLETYSYVTNGTEMLLIEIDPQNNQYVLNCIIAETYDNVNIFDLIKFTGKFPASTGKVTTPLADYILFNENKI